MRVRYEAHLTTLYLQDGEKLRTIIEEMVLPTVQGHILCENWHLCRLCWEEYECKK